jgi:YD repeat-containing protein
MQYFGTDALGSVRQMYNASGQVVASNRYDPY